MQIFFYMALVLGMAFSASAAPLKGSRPNIVFVLTDDQGMNLSYMGHPEIRTPHIDAFAEKALRFRNYYVSPNCAPSRAATLSGVHEFRGAVTATHNECERLALDLTLFPELLQRAGYETAIFGKWHLGDLEPYLPRNRGFNEVLMHGAGGIGQREKGVAITSYADFPPNVARRANCYFDPVLLHNDTIVQTRGYCTDIFFRAALAWMKRQHEEKKPFFAYLSTNTPHAPLITKESDLQRQLARGMDKPNKRWAMIENIDDNFGILMQKLEAWGMLDNTLVIFSSDNGAPHKQEDPRFRAGHKTGKGSVYEGGVHVPAFWYWKGHFGPARDIAALTDHIDLFKTFCELAGADWTQAFQPLEGRSLLPLLEKPDATWPDRMLFTHKGNLAKDPMDSLDKKEGWSVRTQRWRLVGEKLFDIRNDPYEDHDVAAQYPEVVERLSAAHHNWYKTMVPWMINQTNVWSGPAPMELMFERQKKERGIPEWVPPPF